MRTHAPLNGRIHWPSTYTHDRVRQETSFKTTQQHGAAHGLEEKHVMNLVEICQDATTIAILCVLATPVHISNSESNNTGAILAQDDVHGDAGDLDQLRCRDGLTLLERQDDSG